MARKKNIVSNEKKTDTNIPQTPLDQNKKNWVYILILGVICIVFFSNIILGRAHFWEDQIFQEFPKRVFARDSFLSLRFPHWNPYTFSGMPFFAAMQAGVLYPFNVILSLLPLGNTLFWYVIQLFVVLHFFFAGISMFFYLRNRKLTHNASLFGSIGYMLCGFFVTHLVHPMMLNMLVWLPLILLFMEKGIQETKIHFCIISGLILGFSTLAGHPQITFYEFLFLGNYGLYLWIISERKVHHAVLLSVIFLIGIGIALVLLLPAVELSKQSVRTAWTYEQASEGSLSFAQLLTFLTPKVFGAFTGSNETVPRFWLPGPSNGYYTYWDTCSYAGIAILVLALIQLRNIKKTPFLKFALIWGIISLSIALGSHFFVYKFLFHFVPGFGQFRAPARIMFTWNLLLPILAAMTFDQLSSVKITQYKKMLVILLTAAAFIGGFIFLGGLKSFWPVAMENALISRYASIQGGILLLNVVLFALPVILLMNNKISEPYAHVSLIAVLIIDLFIFGTNHHSVKQYSAPSYYSQGKELVHAVRQEQKNEIFRVSMRQFILDDQDEVGRQSGLMILKRNQGMIDKVHMIEGYDALNLYRRIPPAKSKAQFNRFLTLLNVKYYINPDYTNTGSPLILRNQNTLSHAKMFYAAKCFENDSLVKEYMINNEYDYENVLLLSDKPSLPLPSEHSDIPHTVTIKKYTPNSIHIDVTTEENGLLWISEIWYPAWKGYVDKKETKIFCADYSFRALEIPKGTHTVELRYESLHFKFGLFLSLITVIFSFGYLTLAYLKKNKTLSHT